MSSMDSESMKDFMGVTGWKDPLLYIAIVLSAFIYLLLMLFSENSSVGVLETTKGGHIIAVILVWSFLAFFIHSEVSLFAQVHSVLIRLTVVLLLAAVSFIVILPAWGGMCFDSEKIYSFSRLLPFQSSRKKIDRDIILYTDIESISSEASVDGLGSVVLHLKDGRRQYISPNVSSEDFNSFIVTLYDECEWLRGHIVDEFGSMENRKERLSITTSKRLLTSESFFNIAGIFIAILLLSGMVKKALNFSGTAGK